MEINIIRGQNQIGGSIIEVSSKNTKIILDVGSNLDDKEQQFLKLKDYLREKLSMMEF